MSLQVRWSAALLAVLSIGCSPGSSKSSPPTIESLEVKLARPSVPKGQPSGISAVAVYSDGTRTDVSVHATWGTSAPFIASVSCSTNDCMATTANVGTAIFTASYESVQGTVTLSVVAPEAVTLTASLVSDTIPKGTSTSAFAVSDFSDTSTYDVTASSTWTSMDESVAVVSCPEGRCIATGVGIGSTTLMAEFDGLTSTVEIHVNQAIVTAVTLPQSTLTLGVGAMQAVQATGTFSDASTDDVTSVAVWATSNASVATVSAGVITAVGGGQATITASMGVRSASLTVLVEADQTGLVITTEDPVVPLGATLQLGANGLFEGDTQLPVSADATWTSSDTTVATLGAGGLATAVGIGTATITAEYGGFSDTTVLTVGPPEPQAIVIAPVPKQHVGGAPYALQAQVVDTNGGSSAPIEAVAWSSSNTSLATVDAAGLLTPKGIGTVTITAAADGVSGSRQVEIGGALSAVVISPAQVTLTGAAVKLLEATAFYQGGTSTEPLTGSVTWSSSSSSVFVTVMQSSPAQVLVGCNSTGTSTITAAVELASGTTISGQASVSCQ